jgi:predicted unusual protein kinase regulating ubiquinone biosynthesis (AarF/ABC1/UbiB family)
MAATPVSAAERFYRARRIGATFGRIYLGVRANRFIAERLRPRDMPARWTRFNAASAKSIYEAAIELRGLILKGCQFLGSRADVLPREYVEVLSKLQDRVPPKPFTVVKKTIERELGCDLEDVFASIEREPVASASLAQVHEAILKSGERVAVKVQYPEIEALVRSDLANLRMLFRTVDFMERDFDLMPLVDELATYVPRELNFVNEGHNAESVARMFAGRDDVAVPRIHWQLTTRRVLVMDFIDGIKITNVAGLRAAGLDTNRVAQLLAEAYCEQILRHGFFHADPHPGNLLVQRRDDGEPRLVLLDFGLAKDLPPRFREGVVAFASALLQGRSGEMAEALVDLGFETRSGEPEALDAIAAFILDAAVQLRKRGFLDRDFAAELGRELSEQVRANPIVRMPSHLVLVGRVLGLLSGVNRTLETRIDLMATILPYVMGNPRRSAAAPEPTDATAGTRKGRRS